MELLRMSTCIMKILNKKYNKYISEECLDIIQLIKSLEMNKKTLIMDHINTLKSYCKKCYKNIYDEYINYSHDFIIKIKILEKIINSISSLLDSHVFEKTDNLFSLILPFFYTYPEYIEEYN